MKNICVVGLGRLGSSFAACWAKRGYNVVGVDINEKIVQMVNDGVAPTTEPGLQEAMEHHPFTAHTDAIKGTEDADIVFVLVATPSTNSGRFSEGNVIKVCEKVGAGLASSDDYKVVVIASTVSPGAIKSSIIPVLEQNSGKKLNEGFGVCYVPEWVAIGDLINGFLSPELTLIGESDHRAGNVVENLYKNFLTTFATTPIYHTNILNAEIAKVCLNAYVATKITFANTIAQICERMPGADAKVVTDVIGTDGRIGRKFFQGATPYGGPCFTRDIPALKAMLDEVDEPPFLPIAVHEMNKRRTQSIAKLIKRQTANKVAGILGLTFKPDTSVVEDSPSMWVINELRDRCQMMCAYDPEGKVDSVPTYDSMMGCIAAASTVVIMVPWKEFKEMDVNLLAGKTVIDCWRILDPTKLPENTVYIPLGSHSGA